MKKIERWKKIVFSLIPLIFLLIVVEIALRIFPVYKPLSGRTRSGYVIPDPDLTWKLNPELEGSRATNK